MQWSGNLILDIKVWSKQGDSYSIWKARTSVLLPDITIYKKTFHKCRITWYKKEINQSNTIENTKKSHG